MITSCIYRLGKVHPVRRPHFIHGEDTQRLIAERCALRQVKTNSANGIAYTKYVKSGYKKKKKK